MRRPSFFSEGRMQSYVSSILVENNNASNIDFHLEPYGDHLIIPPGGVFEVVGKSEEPGPFHIVVAASKIEVYVWPQCSEVAVFSEGKQLTRYSA